MGGVSRDSDVKDSEERKIAWSLIGAEETDGT